MAVLLTMSKLPVGRMDEKTVRDINNSMAVCKQTTLVTDERKASGGRQHQETCKEDQQSFVCKVREHSVLYGSWEPHTRKFNHKEF